MKFRRVLLLVGLILGVLMLVCAAGAEQKVYSGTFADGVQWRIEQEIISEDESSTTLTFSGNGVPLGKRDVENDESNYIGMAFDAAGIDTPSWIDHVIVGSGITEIRSGALASEWREIGTLEIGPDVKYIRSNAVKMGEVSSIRLNEGLRGVEEKAFYTDEAMSDVLLLPRSLKDIEYGAFMLEQRTWEESTWRDVEITPFMVYSGSEGETYCIESKQPYILVGSNYTESKPQTAAILAGIYTQVNVPRRYRLAAMEALSQISGGLSDAQLTALEAYMDSEAEELEAAMTDNCMSAVEILAFVQRFDNQMRALGLTMNYKIAAINGYPGVYVTVKSGSRIIVDNLAVYRNGLHDWSDELEGRMPDAQDFSYTLAEGGVEITGYKGAAPADGRLVIPASLVIDGETVSVVGVGSAVGKANAIRELEFSEGIRYLNGSWWHFCMNTSAESIILPASMTEFRNNDSWATHSSTVKEIRVAAGNPVVRSIDGVLFDKAGTTLLSYPFGNARTTYTVPAGTVKIVESAFENSTLKSVALPDSLKSIGEDAFNGCAQLTEIGFGSGLEEIGARAFYYCEVLTELALPASVQVIGKDAFGCCFGLKKILLNEGLREIGDEAFEDVAASSVTLPSTLRKLGSGAFYGSELESITLNEGLTEIPYHAFGYTKLKSISLPSTLRKLGNNAFSSSRLESVTLNDGLTSIGKYCFNGTSIRSIHLPSSLRYLGECSLGSNVSIDEIKIPQGMTYLNFFCRAWSNVRAFDSIWIPASVTGYDAESWAQLNMAREEYSVDPMANAMVYGYSGTAAERFAREFGLKFTAIDGETASSLKLSATSMQLAPQSFALLTAISDNSATPKLEWVSSAPKIVCVEAVNGVNVRVRALAMGKASITAYLLDAAGKRSGISAACTVQVGSGEGYALLKLPAGTKTIGREAFRNTAAEHVIVPKGVETIGDCAFYGCKGLKLAEIPDTVKTIRGGAFLECPELVIWCSSNSAAAAYAARNEIPTVYTDTLQFNYYGEYDDGWW